MRNVIAGCGLLILAAGCGGGVSDAPQLVPASGTVLVNDAPIVGANVTFQVEGKPIANGTTNAEGKFTLTTGGRPGAPLGNAKVGISKITGSQENMTTMKPEDMMNMQKQSKGVTPGLTEEIPQKYGNPATSGLTADLSENGDSNVFEFRLVK